MRVLIVKTSSMGDLIHTLPAVTDAKKAIPGISFDWVAEEGFSEIPSWHPAINKVIPIAMRRWRKNIVSARGEIARFVNELKYHEYDHVIDAQGLIKSALVARLAKGLHSGMDNKSCKESLASLFYSKKYAISKQAHAIERIRMLFADVLGYQYDSSSLDYGLLPSFFNDYNESVTPYLVFLHGTSGDYKLWPVEQWKLLTDIATTHGFTVYLPWGSEQERIRAELIANDFASCHVLPKMNLTEIAGLIAHASGVVGVDTGLAHLAAAIAIPGVTIYVDTYPRLTGSCGRNQICISKTKAQQTITTMAGLESVYSETLLADEIWQWLAKKLR
ncbi:MAG: lipopolysaccharide heptosyltransferase I [Methylococcaceae bacterium]